MSTHYILTNYGRLCVDTTHEKASNGFYGTWALAQARHTGFVTAADAAPEIIIAAIERGFIRLATREEALIYSLRGGEAL